MSNRLSGFLFGVSFSLSLFGAAAYAFPTTPEQLCKSIHTKSDSSQKSDHHQIAFKTQLGMKLMPEEYLGISSNGVPFNSQTETIIFTMVPDVEVIPGIALIKKKEKANYKRSRPIQKKLKKLIQTKDEGSCLSKAHELNMNEEQLLEYAGILKESTQNRQLYEAANFLNFAEDAAGVFPNGRVVGVSDSDQITDFISRLEGNAYNFIFVFHADMSGRLYDHSRLIVEQDFFRKVKTKAESIALFSCFPDKVSQYYLKKLVDFKNSGVAVFQPLLKKEFKTLNSAPIGLLEEFSRQLKLLGQDF